MPYGKMDAVDQIESEYKRRSRKRLFIIGGASFLLLVIVAGAIAGIAVSRKNGDNEGSKPPGDQSAGLGTNTPPVINKAIKALCSVTQHPDSCYSSLSAMKGANGTTDPQQLFKMSVYLAMDVLSGVSTLPANLSKEATDPRVKEALEICSELIEDSLEQLNESLTLMTPQPGEKLLTRFKIDDLKTWLSAAITNQDTCLEGFDNTTGGFKEKMESGLHNSTEFTSNSLAIASKILDFLEKLHVPMNRKLLMDLGSDGIPDWVSGHQRRLLQGGDVTPDAVVAKDGSGHFSTVSDALAKVPVKSAKPFVIYVKAGKYVENVEVTKKMTNVVLIGDGPTLTVISGSKNFVDGTPTFNTATFVVEGAGFTAKKIRFVNSAGPEKHQAVAVRIKADHVLFHMCTFDAFQDTLYTHSFRQFFRACDVTGTIDFIFGNAAVVFQSCNIMPRQPMPNQFNTITAQGRKDPNENTGISMQHCNIREFDKVTVPSYLGRPWQQYAITVVMQSEITSVIHPTGWRSWDGSNSAPKSIFYGEYMNTGPGAATAGRIKWSSFHPAMTAVEAGKYTVGTFIQGGEWLNGKGVPFVLTL